MSPEETLSSLAHDLKTPLSMIVGYSELLRARDDEEIRREAPIRIQEAAERLSSAIDDLLSRIECEPADGSRPRFAIRLADGEGRE